MTTFSDVVKAWDQADVTAIHPLRRVGEQDYWLSGIHEAERLKPYLSPTGRVVDFGCGDGRVAAALRARDVNVIGVDSSQRLLDLMDHQVPRVLNDGTNLVEALGGKVASLYCLAVLIHHDYASCRKLIGEFVRAVRVGGTIILDWPVSGAPSERSHWIGVTTWSEVKQKRIEADFNLLRQNTDLPYAVYKVAR